MSDSQTKVEETTTQNESTEETITQPVVEQTTQKIEAEAETVTLPKKEAETLKKKAEDFDGLVEKRRLERLAQRDNKQPEADPNDIKRIAREEAEAVMAERTREQNLGVYKENLQQAYRALKQDFKFLDSDEAMAAVGKYYQDNGETDVETLKLRLEMAVEKAFPLEFRKAKESVIRAKVLAEAVQLNAGNSGGGGSVPPGTVYIPTDEDKRIANKFFGGSMERYLKASKKSN